MADKVLSFQEALDKNLGDFADFNFESLLDPYREGGPSKEEPVRRTWGTIIAWLTGKLRFDMEVVGAAILLVAMELKRGREFKGDGTYGSKGRELVNHIKEVCLEITKRNQTDKVFSLMGKKMYQQIEPMIAEKIRKSLKPWWRRLF